MIWRPATSADTAAILRLTRVPMPGPLQLVWGLTDLVPPPGCSQLQVYVVEAEGDLHACAMTWAWPDGSRYLSGLRVSAALHSRPQRQLWQRAYRDVLAGTDFAWTSIGRDNHSARRLLERGLEWLPEYRPRCELVTCYIPLRRGTGLTPDTELASRELVPLVHRHAALVGGSGAAYRMARIFRLLPPPGQTLRLLAAARPVPTADVRGYDGLIMVFPANQKRPRMPLRHATWRTRLYQVQWDRDLASAPIPVIHGAWL